MATYKTWLTDGSKAKVTATFPSYSDGTPHRGQDIVIYTSPLYLRSLIDGKVIRSELGSGSNWSFGNFVMVQASNGQCVLMAHMASRNVSVGSQVKKGDVLGIMGATGNVTGPHVHVEYHQSAWGKLLDPSLVTGIPNALGTYDVEYAGGSEPGPGPDPGPDPGGEGDLTLIHCAVKFSGGAWRTFIGTSDGHGHIYFNNDNFYRMEYPVNGVFEQYVKGYWARVNTIDTAVVNVLDVSGLVI